MGAMIGKEFVDRGASARSADRPELQKMLTYIKENRERVDYVIVHKVDRLARNRGDDVDITRALAEANVQLVSASESIDNTPSGMLLHGIMSSIAEFYSQNLSTEVKKGMGQKVKCGGTPTKAPLGYKNIRGYDERGRRDSRVELDEQRAPLVRLAFELYATDNWSLTSLAEHLADLGLATPATLKLPSTPMNKRMLHVILHNPYYKGIVTYNGVQYDGRHEALVSEALWDRVQEILHNHINGERERIHEHYLKSTIYCGKCGARLIIHNAKSRTGNRYPYFVCSAKQNRRNDCRQRATLIDEVEAKIEEFYDKISFTPEFKRLMREWLLAEIDKLAETSKSELERLKVQKDKLEREQIKLLQAHYADAIPLHLLKEEQERISKSLKSIVGQMAAFKDEYSQTIINLDDALTLLEDCGRAYRLASDSERRCFNQAFFKRILVYEDLKLEAEYAEPFDALLDNRVFMLKHESEKYSDIVNAGQGEQPAQFSLSDLISAHKTQTSTFFHGAGLSKDILVRETGLEPAQAYCSLEPESDLPSFF